MWGEPWKGELDQSKKPSGFTFLNGQLWEAQPDGTWQRLDPGPVSGSVSVPQLDKNFQYNWNKEKGCWEKGAVSASMPDGKGGWKVYSRADFSSS